LVDLNRTLQDFSRNTRYDPVHVEGLKERVTALLGFRKRWNYGSQDLCDIIAQIVSQQVGLEALGKELEAIQKNIGETEKNLLTVGRHLSQLRHEASQSLEVAVQEKLAAVGMSKANFRVTFSSLQTQQPHPDGLDRLEFILSPDGKLPHQPLKQVASGGEMSRILLALKSALASVDRVETLIFDEIDQGVSGRVAHMVGLQLLELARTHQVIVVTHLAQIASLGQSHHSVQASAADGSAMVKTLTEEERIQELASLLASAGISEGALLNAREMLAAAKTSTSP
jgi:DNA repair protein RecN (Recombination protein N)